MTEKAPVTILPKTFRCNLNSKLNLSYATHFSERCDDFFFYSLDAKIVKSEHNLKNI